MKKTIIFFMFIILFMIFLQGEILAASFSISASPNTITKGNSFTITITGSGVTGRFDLTPSSNISLSQSSVWIENNTVSISATANSAGSGSVTATASNASDDLGNDFTGSKGAYVTISEPTPPPSSSNNSGSSSSSSTSNNKPSTPEAPKPEEKKSNDSKLTSLSVTEGVIAPEFSTSVKEYTLSVPNEITAINVTAATSHSKAKYSIEGGTELQVGDNIVKVIVKAEDGTTTTYSITVNRARAELALQSLTVSFTDENGVITELPLTPLFSFDVYEYTMEKLSHTIKNLNIEALANLEGATVKIEGNEELKEGENKIIITITMPAETSPETGEVIKEEEIKTYTITVEKEAEPIVVPPTFWEKVQNWFAGIGGWFSDNSSKIQTGSLMFCSVAMFALSLYLVIDYKKYKTLVAKLKQLTEMNSTNETVSELTTIDENNNDVENTEIIQEENIEMNETKKKTGRHF